MKKYVVSVLLATASLLLASCAHAPHESIGSPSVDITSPLVSGRLVALCEKPKSCKTFQLELSNQTDSTIEIDWSKSYYLNDDQPDGGLYFDGVVIAQRNAPRSPDIILPNGTFRRNLTPNNSFELGLLPLAHWKIKPFSTVNNGIYLTLRTGGKEEAIKASVRYSSPKKNLESE